MPAETSIREMRTALADVLNDAAVNDRVIYVTNRGRRYAAVVPVYVADEEIERRRAEGVADS